MAQSELELESANDGVRVRLSSGSILVTAAKQRGGHLYVETPDTIVSVVGTVFLVERTSLGTRVGVCEGEVEVARQGLELRKLIPGQQTSTNPSMEGPLVEAIVWSSSAARLSALLQPFAVSPQSPPAVPEKEQKEPPKEQPKPDDEPRTEKPQSPPPPPVPPRPRRFPVRWSRRAAPTQERMVPARRFSIVRVLSVMSPAPWKQPATPPEKPIRHLSTDSAVWARGLLTTNRRSWPITCSGRTELFGSSQLVTSTR